MPTSAASETLPEPKYYLGCYKPGIAGVFHTTGVRLLLVLPFAVAVSISAGDILATLILACWLLGGSWKERRTILRNSPVLLAALPFIALTFIGIFRYEDSLLKSLRYWNGHYPLFYVAVFATLLDRKTDRCALLSCINLAFLLTWFCPVYLAVYYADALPEIFYSARIHSFQLYRNTICFGMALNIWILLWIYLPYSSRHIPLVQRVVPRFLLDAMETASTSLPARWNRTVIMLFTLRWGIVIFATYYLFFVNSSRTAQLAILFAYAAGLLLKTGWRGFAAAAGLIVLLIGASSEFSDIFQKKINLSISESKMFYDLMSGKVNEKKYAKTEYMRLGTYYFLIPAVSEKPVFGWGMEQGQILVKERTRYNDPHSEFLLVVLQHGFAGLILFLFWLLVFLLNTFRFKPPVRQLGICLFIVLCIDCFFNCALSYHREAFLFCFLFAVLFVIESTAELSFTVSSEQ
ncbi:MAG: O-antigen ligase family protein [Planctomycetaceae bacterium]|jgi:hypothetical protein|nr:O-antigen ligase family protein [Planctomycetaceae bacterium]